MKISGSYIERYLYNILAWFIPGGIIIIVYEKESYLIVIFSIVFISVLFWLIDTIRVRRRKAKSLILNNGIYIDKEFIDIITIQEIIPIVDKSTRMTFRSINFILIDGRTLVVLDRCYNLIESFTKKYSKTARKLIEVYPELKEKIKDIKVIY